MARAVLAETTWTKGDNALTSDAEGEHPFMLIHCSGEVTKLSTVDISNPALIARATRFLHEKFGAEIMSDNIIRLVPANNIDQLPIVTLCSKSRHADALGAGVSAAPTAKFRLDINTAELAMVLPSSTLTINKMGLEEVLIDGVLDLYVTTRKYEVGVTRGTSLGKAAIFEKAAHWEPKTEDAQSERGMALFLSTLRVLCNILSKRQTELQMRDAFLGLFHQLTNFPPAVRAMHVLLRDETPTDGECAAISQAVYQLLDKYMPLRAIQFDKSRLFETSRLFFGLMLEKVKHICRANPGDASEPYLTSMKMVELSNSETTEPLLDPVDTDTGLLERGHFEALKAGLIKFSDETLDTIPRALDLDGRTRRAALLSGGMSQRVLVFDMDILHSIGKPIASRDHPVINASDLDLSHLAVLCSRNGLTVAAPARLANSDSPVLTLDSNALGAVYCGRQPCGTPGQDFMLYRPTRGGDSTIDPAIVTQLIAPILASRQADGSGVFDAPGDVAQRKIETPDEILMVCVDCSASMSEGTGFVDMVEDDPLPPKEQTLIEKHELTSEVSALAAQLDEVKEWITEHESFDDILRIIQKIYSTNQASVARLLLAVLAEHASKALKEESQKLANANRYTWAYRHDPARELSNLKVESLKKFIVNLSHHETSIIDWLVFRSRMLIGDDNGWEWSLGQPVPGFSDVAPVFASDAMNLALPDEYLCAISYELMADPVTTADGHTYDRQAIQQWLQINNTSPKTGLALANTRLSTQRRLTRDINSWIDGAPYIGGRGSVKVSFSSRLGTFERKLKAVITCNEVYNVVFQALRGRHTTFELKVQGRISSITPSDANASSHGISDGCIVNIMLPDSSSGVRFSQPTTNASTDRVLIKVYGRYRQFEFSYWVPKTTKLTMGSVLFKYWRKMVQPYGFAGDMKEMVTWTNMENSGDGHCVGHVRKCHEPLSTYLHAQFATGKFEAEDLFEQSGGIYNGVLKVWAASKPQRSRQMRTTRLDVLKQMFDQFVNRTIAYGYNTHIGLINFSSSATVSRALTDVVEDFRTTVQQLQARGDTAMYDALALARHQIDQYAGKFPNAKKRILCITDGEDTKSTSKVEHVANDIVKSGIVVDSFCLGDEDHDSVLAVSYLSGGYKFVPKTLAQAMAICELEPVLALQDREDVVLPNHARGSTPASRFNLAKYQAIPETVNADVYPHRRAHPNIDDDVIELATAKKMASGHRTGTTMLRNSRLLTEIQSIIAQPHPAYDVFVSERDISFWKIVMQGPAGSPYESGTFMLYLDLVSEWPTFAPKARFVTPIHHPNVNVNGRICHSIFDRNWTSDTSAVSILNSVYGLLLVPDYSDPV